MKLAAYVLWALGFGLFCLMLWIAFAGPVWESDQRVIPIIGAAALILTNTASILSERARRRAGIGPSPPIEATKERRRQWATGGGFAVVLLTGLAAFGGGFFEGSPGNALLGPFVIVVTLGGAFALHRFIARHGDQIGEARFDTRNREEG